MAYCYISKAKRFILVFVLLPADTGYLSVQSVLSVESVVKILITSTLVPRG